MVQRLGPYPIEREIGRGGMGVVYLGRDSRLDRPVAIKVLPEHLAADPERLARFDREARLLASLSHPNIAGIYGLEQDGSQRLLVLEYVEGQTLADQLLRGPMTVLDTLDAGLQIAAALEAAHEAGVIHRDLKPANVKITPAGALKVLDFGLAKGPAGTADSNSDLSRSPTLTHQVTSAGVILGTAAYMSPEQARGKPVDRRTDIWSFGCVLYECLTGRQAFAGETVSDVIAQILQGEPDWTKLPPDTPPRLRELIERCLEKDARRRLRDMGDARLEIEGMRRARSSGPGFPAPAESAGAATPARSRAAWWPALLLLVAGAAAGIGTMLVMNRQSETTPYRFHLEPPPGLDLYGDPNDQAISPDGRTMVVSMLDSLGSNQLWLRSLDRFDARPLDGTREANLPFWSPDSRQIGFFSEGKLRRLRIGGGNSEVVCDAPNGRGGSWNARDLIVFAPNPSGPLYSVRASGGTPVAVTAVDTAQGETAHRWPCFLPDGEHFTYGVVPIKSGGFSYFIGSTRGMKRTPLLTAITAPIYAAPGHLIFSRNDALLAQRIDLRSLRLVGDPFAIGDPPSQGSIYSASPCASVSANGTLAWISAGAPECRLQWLDRTGRITGDVDIAPNRWLSVTGFSKDGRLAALEQQASSGSTDLWVADLERGTTTRITFGQGRNNSGVFSPDGREVIYSSTRNGKRTLYRRAADGSGSDRLFYESAAPFKDASSWSADGRWVLVSDIGINNNWDVFAVNTTDGSTLPLLTSPFNEQFPAFSADGRWITYVSDESGTSLAYVRSFPDLGRKQQISKNAAYFAALTSSGKEALLIRPDGVLVSIPVQSGSELRFGTPQELFKFPRTARWLLPVPDGQRFLLVAPVVQTPPLISVAVNWRAGQSR